MLEGLFLLNDFVLISVTIKDKPRKLALNSIGKILISKLRSTVKKLVMVNCNSSLSHESTDADLEDGKQTRRYAFLLPLSLVF